MYVLITYEYFTNLSSIVIANFIYLNGAYPFHYLHSNVETNFIHYH